MKLEKFRPSFLDKAQGWLQIVMMIAYLVCLGVVLYLLGAVTAFVWVTGIKLFIIFCVALLVVGVVGFLLQVISLIQMVKELLKKRVGG